MIRKYMIFAKWRKKDIDLLKTFNLPIPLKTGYLNMPVDEGITLEKIKKHYKKKDLLFSKTRPEKFNIKFIGCSFTKEEKEAAKSYSLRIGTGKLEHIDSHHAYAWKYRIYDKVCEECQMPIGKQSKPWVLKRDFKQLDKYPFLGFESIPGYVFCGKHIANMIKKEFGIGNRKVLIGKQERVSEYLVQLDIPISPYKLNMDSNRYGDPYESNNWTNCTTCNQYIYTNQERDFFPSFQQFFDFDMLPTQEWFGWYRRIVLSKKFINFCLEKKLLNKRAYEALVPQEY